MGRMYFSRILVFMDTQEGPLENLILHYRGLVQNQILDYEGIPCHFHECHRVGHVYKEFPLILKQK